MLWTGRPCRRRQSGYGACANVPQVPQVHQSCVRTDLSTVRQLRPKTRDSVALEVLIPLILPSTRKPRETGALVAVHPNHTPHPRPRYERSAFGGPDVLAYETSTSASHEGRPTPEEREKFRQEAAWSNLHECNDRIATFLGIGGRQEKGRRTRSLVTISVLPAETPDRRTARA
jgi:hypothetical protein